MRAITLFVVALSAAFVGACNPDCPGGLDCAIGPSCQSSCEKLFGEGGEAQGECNIQVTGSSASEMMGECLAHCQEAMRTAGEAGDYDPNEKYSSSDAVALENEQQAALWMDCIADSPCELLDPSVPGGGYCAPTTNFP